MAEDWERYLPQIETTPPAARQRWDEPNLGLTSVKRQHYVPRMYLEAFSDVAGKIRVLDLDSRVEPTTTSLVNAAAQGRYYDLSDEDVGGTRLSTEDWLSEVEGDAAPVIRRLRDDPASVVDLAPLEQEAMARFAVSLRFRVPAFRSEHESMFASMASQMKEMVKPQVYAENSPAEAERIWRQLDALPAERWLGGLGEYNAPMLVADMLSEVQGFANLLLKMPWRVGFVPETMPLYTSDNPMSRYLTPIRVPGDMGMFMTFDYYLPLSPRTLLRFERVPNLRKLDRERPGPRRHLDFSAWHASFARHVVTYNATRFLFGEATPVPRDCGESCLGRVERATIADAERLSGFHRWMRQGYRLLYQP